MPSVGVAQVETKGMPRIAQDTLLPVVLPSVRIKLPAAQLPRPILQPTHLEITQARKRGELFPPEMLKRLLKENKLDFTSLPVQATVYADEKSFVNQWGTKQEMAKLSVKLQLNEQLNIETSGLIGLSQSVLNPIPMKNFHLYSGLEWSPSEDFQLKMGMNYGGMERNRFWGPSTSLRVNLRENLMLELQGGYLFNRTNTYLDPTGLALNTMYGSSFGANGYGNLTLNYKFNNGIYLYGRAGFNTFNPLTTYPNSQNRTLFTQTYGAGLGYYIPGAGPIGFGIDFVQNPITGRMEPQYQINPVGLVIFLLEKIHEAISE